MNSKEQLEQSIRRHKRAVLLVNTRSRKGQLFYDVAKAKLEARGYSFIKTFAIKHPEHINRTIKKALALKPELLIVGSGDGTLSTVADHLAYADVVLGYLPLGTTNNFGRSLQIPPSLDAAIDVIVNGKVADVDLGKVNGDYFGNMVSMGVSEEIAATVPRKLKRRFGRLAYAWYAVKTIAWHKPFRVEVHTSDSRHFFYTHQFCVANGTMHAGKPIAADAHVDNSTIVAFAMGGKRRLTTVLAMVRHFRGANEKMHHKNLMTGTYFTVRTFPHKPIEVDGEVRHAAGQHEYMFEVAFNALKVFVPQTFKDE